VIPGSTASFRISFSVQYYNSSTWAECSPTRLLSPFNTLKSWGSSSMVILRVILAVGVTRGSFSPVYSEPSGFFRSGASNHILRYPNRKSGIPFLPRRFCLYMHGASTSGIETASVTSIIRSRIDGSPLPPTSSSRPWVSLCAGATPVHLSDTVVQFHRLPEHAGYRVLVEHLALGA
jgi:hypothetical protein